MSKWANTMITSEFDKSNPAQQGFTENVGTASLPDIDHLTKLANQLFSELPCDGSRLGIDASAVPGGLSSSLAGLNKSGVTGFEPQGFGLPGEAELRQLLAPRKPSFESVPDSLDTGPVIGNPYSASAPGLSSPLAGLDKDVLAGVFAHNFGLPGESELQKLLVSHVPAGSSILGGVDAGTIPAVPSSVAAQELTAESLADSEKQAEAGISPQVFETELQKLFAANRPATGSLPSSATGNPLPGTC